MGRDIPEDDTEDDYFDSGNERDRVDAPRIGSNSETATYASGATHLLMNAAIWV